LLFSRAGASEPPKVLEAALVDRPDSVAETQVETAAAALRATTLVVPAESAVAPVPAAAAAVPAE